jgi:hypothetical protein
MRFCGAKAERSLSRVVINWSVIGDADIAGEG